MLMTLHDTAVSRPRPFTVTALPPRTKAHVFVRNFYLW
jgi:hypothetical protein